MPLSNKREEDIPIDIVCEDKNIVVVNKSNFISLGISTINKITHPAKVAEIPINNRYDK